MNHHFIKSRCFAKGMAEGGRGSIINMSSANWSLGLGKHSAEVTAKAAIEGVVIILAAIVEDVISEVEVVMQTENIVCKAMLDGV